MVSPLERAERIKSWREMAEMTPSGQRRWVEHLQALINTMESGTPEEMAAIGYDRFTNNIPHALEVLYWRTSQALRVSYRYSRLRRSSILKHFIADVFGTGSGLHPRVSMKPSHT